MPASQMGVIPDMCSALRVAPPKSHFVHAKECYNAEGNETKTYQK